MSPAPSADDIIASFPNSLPKIDGQPNYDRLRLAKSLLKQNAAAIPTNRGGGQHGYLGLVLTDAAYANISQTPFVAPVFPGATPQIPAGATGPVIANLVESHKEELRDWREFVNVSTALKKQFINCIEPIYLRAKIDRNTGFSNITLRDLIAYCISTYGKIAPADIANNESTICKAWDSDTPFELLIEQIEDCQEFADNAGQPFSDAQILTNAYNLVYNTGAYFDECKTWNAKPAVQKTWDNFKAHFLLAQDQLRMQQATSKRSGFHGANYVMDKHQNTITQQIYEETAEALANLATATASDRKAMETLTNTVATLTQQLSAKDAEIKKLKEQLANKRKKETAAKPEPTDNGSYCWSHGYCVAANHTSCTCRFPKPGHKKEATRDNNMGGSQAGKPP